MKKYITEFIGTFFLVLGIGLVVGINSIGDMAPIAIGTMLMVMVYAGGHVSGAHYNPAITLAAWIRGKCPSSDVVPYMISQIAGAAVAGLLVVYMKNGDIPSTALPIQDIPRALIAEVLGTFALAYVVLNVATSEETAGNSYYGLAIGFAVMALAYSLGGYSGGAFNPAVALALCIMKLLAWADIWIFLLACFAAAALAAVVFKYLNPADKYVNAAER